MPWQPWTRQQLNLIILFMLWETLPPALLRIIELVNEKRICPDLIIGMPEGFVNAAESKDALMETTIPHISNRGRKGGSNVAAAIVNALAIMAAG